MITISMINSNHYFPISPPSTGRPQTSPTSIRRSQPSHPCKCPSTIHSSAIRAARVFHQIRLPTLRRRCCRWNQRWRTAHQKHLVNSLYTKRNRDRRRFLGQLMYLRMQAHTLAHTTDALSDLNLPPSYRSTNAKAIDKVKLQHLHLLRSRIHKPDHTDVIVSTQARASPVIQCSRDPTILLDTKTRSTMHASSRFGVTCARKRRPSRGVMH